MLVLECLGSSSLSQTLPSLTCHRTASCPQSVCPLLVGVFRNMSGIDKSALCRPFHPQRSHGSLGCPPPLPGSPGDASVQPPAHKARADAAATSAPLTAESQPLVRITQTALQVPCLPQFLMKITPSDLFAVNLIGVQGLSRELQD